ncbi:T9SS type A sorting domain-containing protein, partial [bacterium]|nr:T9SS type A sorting domain-containing protein [bacterium]
TEYALHQNYPNPFNPETNISFDLAEAGAIKLTVFNPLGQTVATLVNGTMASGRHTIAFDGTNLTSGLYYYRLEAGDFSAIRKMVLMK